MNFPCDSVSLIHVLALLQVLPQGYLRQSSANYTLGRQTLGINHADAILQVTEINRDTLSFDIIVETLRATNLGTLQVASCVNFERSARIGDEIGGHNVSGHVCSTAQVAAIEVSENNRRTTFKVRGLGDGWQSHSASHRSQMILDREALVFRGKI